MFPWQPVGIKKNGLKIQAIEAVRINLCIHKGTTKKRQVETKINYIENSRPKKLFHEAKM
jgi:hypothetical protein